MMLAVSSGSVVSIAGNPGISRKGEKWGVNSLKMLVLSKLHRTLSMPRLDASKVQHVIDLARYAYSDSSTPDSETEIDGLRKLILPIYSRQYRGSLGAYFF
jgi:hypothetical protein